MLPPSGWQQSICPLGHLGYTFNPVCIVGIGPLTSKYAKRYKSINLFDFLAQKYAIMRRSYRLWRYLFSFCFQAAIINAYILYMETSKLPRTKNFTQSDFRLLLGKQLIDGFSVCKYEPKVEPIFVGPGNPNTTIKNHENTRMPSAHGKLCKTHRDHFPRPNALFMVVLFAMYISANFVTSNGMAHSSYSS